MHGRYLWQAKFFPKSRADVFKSITAKIIASIEAGAGTFTMPWHGSIIPPTFPVNAATDAPYRGVNILSLWADGMFKRYIGGYWASYRQWQTLGAQVRKGERGSMIIFYKKLDPKEECGTARPMMANRVSSPAPHMSSMPSRWTVGNRPPLSRGRTLPSTSRSRRLYERPAQTFAMVVMRRGIAGT